ncbi:MAG: hypothetical protein ABFD25_00600 [Clostridiaceae bacterium]
MVAPFYTFSLQTQYNSDEVRSKFKNIVNEGRPILKRMYANDEFSSKPFCGSINGYNLKISRIISNGNPVLPIIKIRIKEVDNSTCVKFYMRISMFAAFLILLWFSVGIFMCIFADSLAPLIILLLGYLAVTIPFYIQSRNLKDYFAEMMI